MTAATSSARAPRRPRRIAADEAHAWARNLRLSNPYAKLVLSMLTIYVNGEGSCFVGASTLAEDCELALETVRKRLAWLEEIGAITRLPQWLDENGRRNSEGRGKRTTDDIKLNIETDPDEIERLACGDDPSEFQPAVSPLPCGGQNQEPESPAPQPGVCQPPSCVGGLTSEPEPEPESNPQPPKGGSHEAEGEDQENDAKWTHEASWQRLETAWADPILHQRQCRQLWSAFTDPERERFIRVVRGYLAWRLAQPKLPNRVNIQKLMRERESWPAYEKLAGPDPSLRTFVVEKSTEDRALQVIALIGGWQTRPSTFDTTQGCRGYWRVRPTLPDEMAMAQFLDKPFEQWTPLNPDMKGPFFAWLDRLREWTGARAERMRVPCLYPPAKDGSISTGPPPSPP